MLNANDVLEATKRGMETFEKLKREGSISYCCLSDANIVEINMIIQLIKMHKLKGRVTITLIGDGNEG